MSTIKTIGKAKIDLSIRGCIDCGTEHSSGWEVARTVDVAIAGKVYQGQIHRCADCSRKKQKHMPTLFDLAGNNATKT